MDLIHQQLIDKLVVLSLQACEAILAVYHSDKVMEVGSKEDCSPVTEADIAAHRVLVDGLSDLLPDTPVLSEESEMPTYDERRSWSRYWLVDPLDGTKEFIDRNGEFTVNIALIENGEAVLGVVAVPVSGELYYGAKGLGAYKRDKHGGLRCLHARSINSRLQAHSPVEIVASRRHRGLAMDNLREALENTFGALNYKNMGSSLKLCLIAEGKADLYPRLAPTSEWDTAAAHAIVDAAGGQVLDEQLQPLRYNTKESLLNPYFYVIGDTGYDWTKLLADK